MIKIKWGKFLCVPTDSPMNFTQNPYLQKNMTLSYRYCLLASGTRQLFCFSLYLISLQMQVFYKRIRNFLFSPVSTSLHLVYNCYIIQYVKD